METQVKKLPKAMVEITIEESAENISKFRKKAIEKLSKNADIKGFRKGTAIPEAILVKHYTEEYILTLTVDEALNKLYSEALKVNKIFPVSQGEIKEVISQSPLKIVMTVEVFPEIEIKDEYKKIKLPKTKTSVEDKEVQDNLDQIQTKFTKFEEANEGYESKMGDKLYINTQGFDTDGKKLENTNMEDYPLVLGSNLLVPGFEEGLVGKKAKETLTLDITFPKDYHNKDFAGKKTKFEVTINKIETAVKPEFTKEFIKNLRGKDLDFDGFKELIKQEIAETKEMNARMTDENTLIDELLKISTVDFGDSMLKNQTEKVFSEIKENIIASGAKVNDYIASLGITEDEYITQNVVPVATKRLQAELLLHKLGELEKIEVTDDEMNKEIENVISRFGSPEVVERLKELYKPETRYYEELRQRLSYRKLIDSFFN